jgi:MCP family monocarboxylic acid transporter-like MFS transporter 10
MGNVLSTPIAAALYAGKTDAGLASHHTGFKVDGGRYESMIIYVGTGFAGAALLSAIGWGLDKRARA